MKMNQPGTDRGERGESGEKEPKGVDKADSSGERHGKVINGIGMGEADGLKGRSAGSKEMGEFNTGRTSGVCYKHTRDAYKHEDKKEEM